MSELDRVTRAELAHRSPMEPDDIRRFLAKSVASYDNRNVGPAMTTAWTSAAQVGEWTLDEAAEASVIHHATRPGVYFTPAHVTEHVRHSRRVAALSGGSRPDGRRVPSHADALALWAEAMRMVAGSPTDDQRRTASAHLASMLDGADDPIPVLAAAVMAARGGSEHIDRARTKLLRAPDVLRAPPLPPEYLADSQLDVHNAVRHTAFPADWAVYPAESRRPQWIADWMAESGGVFTPEETRARNAVRHQADEWEADDVAAWRTERMPVVRQFLDDPAHRDYSALDAVRLDQPVRTVDPNTGRTFER